MRQLSILIISTLPYCLWAPAHAASVYRCSDTEGAISFTQHGCPPGSQVEQQRTRTPNLLNSTPPSDNDPGQYVPIQKWEESVRTQEIVVVGEQDAVCGNQISAQERRRAIIRKQIRSGMTRADVESALGKPDRISGRNGQLRYHYQPSKGTRYQVQFDEEDCVKGGH